MNVIEATYRITTPMFCSGADQQKAELRLASFKGALRFWWRTLMWRHTQDVNELHRREAELFGASDQNYGQSKVRLRMGESNLAPEISPPAIFERGQLQGAHYLGYGVMEAFSSSKKGTEAGQLTRPMIPHGTFTVRFAMSPKISDAQCQQLFASLVLLGTVGGLGSKSRKGFGSLTLTRLSEAEELFDLPNNPEQRLKQVLRDFSPLMAQLPEWTAWSEAARVVEVSGAEEPCGLLNLLGKEQVHYRSWGKGGRVLGQKSEENFPEDHALFYQEPTSLQHPKRVAFGLPHNYGQPARTHVAPASRELDRRASALFLHIHQLGDEDTPLGLVAFLPARFLPAGEQISAFQRNVALDNSSHFWDPITGYLDRLAGKQRATARKTAIKGKEVSLG